MHTALEEVEIFKIVCKNNSHLSLIPDNLRLFLAEYDRTTKENKPARFLKSGYIGNVRIQVIYDSFDSALMYFQRPKTQSAVRNTKLCQVWVDLLSETKEEQSLWEESL